MEHALRQRGILNGPSEWTALEGGRTNRLWRVSRPEGDIVAKLYKGETRNPLFPNDPASEVRILEHLATLGVAPTLLDHFRTDVGFCLIYSHLEGRAWHADCTKVATLLHRLHQTPPPSGVRRTPDGSDAIRSQGRAILDLCPSDLAEELRRLEPQEHIPASGLARLLHADPVPTNIIDHVGKLRLIDWQCPAVGDPCEDIAVFLSPAMQLAYRGTALTADERNTFLAAYPDAKTTDRYRQMEPWYHWRMAAYCLWKETQGDRQARPGYDAEIAALTATFSEQV